MSLHTGQRWPLLQAQAPLFGRLVRNMGHQALFMAVTLLVYSWLNDSVSTQHT